MPDQPTAKPDTAVDVLTQAADLIAQYGLHHGGYRGPRGSMCALGALWTAASGDTTGVPRMYLHHASRYPQYRDAWGALLEWLHETGQGESVAGWSDQSDTSTVAAGMRAAAAHVMAD